MARVYLWTGSGVTEFLNSTAYTVGQRMVPKRLDNGTNHANAKRYVWECTTAGTTDPTDPVWSASYTPDSSTLTSNTAVFTCRNPGYSSGSTENWSFATIYLVYAAYAAQPGDEIYVHYTSKDELNVDTTITFNNPVEIFSVDKDNSNALRPMGTDGWMGNSTTNRAIVISSAGKMYTHGVTFRVIGGDNLILGAGDGTHQVHENAYLWGPGAAGYIIFGTQDASSYVQLINPSIRFSVTNSNFRVTAKLEVFGGSVLSVGSVPSMLLQFVGTDPGGASAEFFGTDLGHCTTALVGDSSSAAGTCKFWGCKISDSATRLSTQTHPNRSSVDVYLYDCAQANTYRTFEHHNPLGSTITDSTVFLNSLPEQVSWKITTTSECDFYRPYESPAITWYTKSTLPVTPYLEILRNGDTTKFQDNQVWIRLLAQVTTGSTLASMYNSRMAIKGSAVDLSNGIGVSSWTGGISWSGKIALASSITPTGEGSMLAQVLVGRPSTVVYVNPQIRT